MHCQKILRQEVSIPAFQTLLANLAATEEVVAVIVMVVGTMTMFTERLLHACQALWQTLNHCHLIQRSPPAKGSTHAVRMS